MSSSPLWSSVNFSVLSKCHPHAAHWHTITPVVQKLIKRQSLKHMLETMDGHSWEKSVKNLLEVDRVLKDVDSVVISTVSTCLPCKYRLGRKRMRERERAQGRESGDWSGLEQAVMGDRGCGATKKRGSWKWLHWQWWGDSSSGTWRSAEL